MYSKIVIGFDNSPASKLALQKAAFISEKFNAAIIIVTVIEPLDAFFGEPIPQDLTKHQKLVAEKIIEKAENNLRSMGITNYKKIIKIGLPAQEIINTAKEENADLIIVGRKGGKGFLEKFVLGSVSQTIVNTCVDIDVLVVPFKEPKETEI